MCDIWNHCKRSLKGAGKPKQAERLEIGKRRSHFQKSTALSLEGPGRVKTELNPQLKP